MRYKRGFTVLELVITILVILILFIILISNFSGVVTASKETGVQTDMRSFYIATEAAINECYGDFKTQEGFLSSLNRNLPTEEQFYIGEDNVIYSSKKDPWGQHYELYCRYKYNTEGVKESYIIFTSKGTGNSDGWVFVPKYNTDGLMEQGVLNTEQYKALADYKYIMIYALAGGQPVDVNTEDLSDITAYVLGEEVPETILWQYTINSNNTANLTRYLGDAGSTIDLIVPNTIDGYTVSTLKQSAGLRSQTFNKVSIQEGVYVEDQAFLGCTIESLYVAENVTLGKLFSEYTNQTGWSTWFSPFNTHEVQSTIKNVELHSNVGTNSFNNCGVEFLVIGPEVTSICACAFNNNQITNAELHLENVTHIGSRAFYNAINDSTCNITIPEGVVVGFAALYGCTFNSVNVADGVELCKSAFSNSTIQDLYIGTDVSMIEGSYSVIGATGYYTETSFGRAYKTNKKAQITNLEIHSDVPSYEFCGAGIKTILIGSEVTTIGDGAFSRCDSIVTINNYDGAVTIATNAFADTATITYLQ